MSGFVFERPAENTDATGSPEVAVSSDCHAPEMTVTFTGGLAHFCSAFSPAEEQRIRKWSVFGVLIAVSRISGRAECRCRRRAQRFMPALTVCERARTLGVLSV